MLGGDDNFCDGLCGGSSRVVVVAAAVLASYLRNLVTQTHRLIHVMSNFILA